MARIYLGIGSNLGNRRENINKAIALLKDNRIKVKNVSRIIETCPVGGPKQGKFLNAALEAQTSLGPKRLLDTLKSIEIQLGRKKTIRFGPRPIDLDILFYDRANIKTRELTIPHPKIFERDFVLKPLKEIAPYLIRTNHKMKIVKSVSETQSLIKAIKRQGKTIGFVPTLGYLHEGHLSLMRRASKDCDVSVISIFVNPTQFGPYEDFKKYPRDLKRDENLARSTGVDIVFCPSVKEMYPNDYLTNVNVEKITDVLCGDSRLGHFKGVTTVVAKLFNIVQPDIVYFGQKDAQQTRVIQQMIKDLNIPIKIKSLPIVREKDGLAMSSRNKYLSSKERRDALVLLQSLRKARTLIKKGKISSSIITSMIRKMISTKKSAKIDYVVCVDFKTFKPVKRIRRNALIALAVWVGKTRLIDNIIIK